MAKKRKGWIKLYRDLQDNALWSSDIPFDERSAWVDLLLTVNHEDGQVFTRNKEFVPVKRGSTLTSLRKLAERWHWSANRVKRFLETLSAMKMVKIETHSGTHSGTLLSVVKYDDFQGERNTHEYTDEHIDEHTGEYTDEYTDEVQTRNKEIKNDKEREEASSSRSGRDEIIELTEEEVKEWYDKNGSGILLGNDRRQLDIPQGTERSRVQQLRDLLYGITIVPGGGSATGDSECD